MKNKTYLILILLSCFIVRSQKSTRKDSLQGGMRPERACYDVLHYDLNIKIDIINKSIVGFNEITFKTVTTTSKIQVDLFENMQVDSIIYNANKLDYKRDFGAVFINFPKELKAQSEEIIRFYYSGKPIIAKKAPWDGGFVFDKDLKGNPWIGVACQGTGASLWYPCKDSQTDEPNNGAIIRVSVPNGLINVSNGKLIGSEDLKNGYTRWDWKVVNPINNYDITVNIANYAHIHDSINGLDLDYYVLPENVEKAKKHFIDVKPMLSCYQKKFGEFPFKEDGYKLVETPYLAMEHQSCIAYGNKYLKGYLGRDRSTSGIGMNFDYIIIHETGHEWFGNSITSNDIADMWIHESFTTYAESVFVECQYGYEKGQEYINGLINTVYNDKPIIGNYGVNNEGSYDMYSKGALMLNTIRHIINDDEKWWELLLKYSKTYQYQIIDSETVIQFFNTETGLDLTTVFNQYLRFSSIPKLQFKKSKKRLEYKWISNVTDFDMPIDLKINNKKRRIHPATSWKTSTFRIKNMKDVEVLTSNFYININ